MMKEQTRPISAASSSSFSVHESAWTRTLTEDQRVYFFNRATGASQWSIPNELYNGRYLIKDLDPEEDLLVMPSVARASLGAPRGTGVDCITERPGRRPNFGDEFKQQSVQLEEESSKEEEYVPQGSALKIIIHGASGLRDADFMPGRDKSDPFCRVEIIGKPDTKCESHVVSDCLDPVWDYECQISGVFEGDILLFQVFDLDDYLICDTTGNIEPSDFLGRLMLPLEDIPSGPVDMQLEDTGLKNGQRSILSFSVVRLDFDA